MAHPWFAIIGLTSLGLGLVGCGEKSDSRQPVPSADGSTPPASGSLDSLAAHETETLADASDSNTAALAETLTSEPRLRRIRRHSPDTLAKRDSGTSPDSTQVIAPPAVDTLGPPPEIAFEAPSDTLEPGATGTFKLGEPKGHGPITWTLDADGDGQSDAKGLTAQSVAFAWPRAGVYTARLTLTDAHGLTRQSEGQIRVNARPRVKAVAKAARVNLVTPFQVKLEFEDPDDSVARLFATWPDTLPPASVTWAGGSKNQGKAYWMLGTTGTPGTTETQGAAGMPGGTPSRAWKAPGRHSIHLTAIAADGRAAQATLAFEVFNAKPTCRILPGLKPSPGVPVALRGEAEDPDGRLVRFEWDLDGDGRYEWSRESNDPVAFTFARKGKFKIAYRVTSDDQTMARDSTELEVRASW